MYRVCVATFVMGCGLYAQSTPEPLDWQQRWDQYIERTYSWKRIGMVAAGTALDDTFQFNKCGRPPYCFPHHLGGSLVRRTARTTMEFGASGLLGEDLRRRPSGESGFRKRFAYAMTHAMLAKDRDGEWRPAYSRYLGTIGAVAVSSAYNGRPLNTEHMLRGVGWTLTDYFQDAFFAEFEPDLLRLGSRTWQFLRRR